VIGRVPIKACTHKIAIGNGYCKPYFSGCFQMPSSGFGKNTTSSGRRRGRGGTFAASQKATVHQAVPKQYRLIGRPPRSRQSRVLLDGPVPACAR
jgi:hypothetical protein